MTHVLARSVVVADQARTEERLLDVRQLAAYLGLADSRLWLMRLLHASLRGPRSVRVAGRSYWWRSDVDEWLRCNDLEAVLRRLGEDVIAGAREVRS
jgi:predicted DNA-binding transcriptional regulator AlpA